MMLNEDLLRDFEERVAGWDALPKIADVIVRKGPYLKLYTVYIRDFSAMNFHFEEVCARHPKFGRLVREFEKRPRCAHLRLQHFMLKPVQRLPQYRLLLEDYLRHLDPQSPDFDDTAQALRIVSEAAEHANNTVKQGVRKNLTSGADSVPDR
jgi:FYVE/RhoGEF/PH domain-containing protein 5/6